LACNLVEVGNREAAFEHVERCNEILDQGEDWRGVAGFARRARGALAAATGKFGEAEEAFSQAVAIFRRYRLVWEEAETLDFWGRALGFAGENSRAVEKFDAVIDVYRRHGAGQRWVDRVLSASAPYRDKGNTDRASGQRPMPTASRSDASFRRDGEFWTISYAGHTFRLKNAKGLHYIAHLLSHPGEKFRVHDLVAVVEGPPDRAKATARSLPTLEVSGDLGDLGPILDDKAKASYRRRRQELREELDEAEAMNDEGRAQRARAEIEILEQQLTAAIGLGGRDRKTSAHAERARVVVTRNIRAILGKIEQEHPPLGSHFNAAIKTGYLCTYFPDAESTVAWKL
jgi:tetratricopeptide (TPR) repeat protein